MSELLILYCWFCYLVCVAPTYVMAKRSRAQGFGTWWSMVPPTVIFLLAPISAPLLLGYGTIDYL